VSDDRTPDFESGGIQEVNLQDVPSELGILPLRDTILFPHAILPLAVGHDAQNARLAGLEQVDRFAGHLNGRDRRFALDRGGGWRLGGRDRGPQVHQ